MAPMIRVADGWSLANAVGYAQKHDRDDLFDERADVGPHAIQSGVSAIAACVIRFGEDDSPYRAWAWSVMERVLRMREPSDFYGSKIPWHPSFSLIAALFGDLGRLWAGRPLSVNAFHFAYSLS